MRNLTGGTLALPCVISGEQRAPVPSNAGLGDVISSEGVKFNSSHRFSSNAGSDRAPSRLRDIPIYRTLSLHACAPFSSLLELLDFLETKRILPTRAGDVIYIRFQASLQKVILLAHSHCRLGSTPLLLEGTRFRLSCKRRQSMHCGEASPLLERHPGRVRSKKNTDVVYPQCF